MTQHNLKIVNNQNGNNKKFHFYSELGKVTSDTRLRGVRTDAQRKYTDVSIHKINLKNPFNIYVTQSLIVCCRGVVQLRGLVLGHT